MNLHIPDDLAKRLQSLADKTGQTRSYYICSAYICSALEEKITELEDYYIALENLEKVQSGKMRTWTQKELEHNRDIEN